MAKAITFCMLLVLLTFSCTSGYKYLEPNEPARWNSPPCLRLEKKDLQYQAFMAILYSVHVQKWVFSRIDSGDFSIEARIGKEKFAPEMIITVDKDGLVLISRKSFLKLSRNELRLTKRRMGDLDRIFNKHRCESIESLEKQVKRFGIKRGG